MTDDGRKIDITHLEPKKRQLSRQEAPNPSVFLTLMQFIDC